MKKKTIYTIWKNTFSQVSGVTIALISGIALVQIFLFSGRTEGESMVAYMAEGIHNISSKAYPYIAMPTGILGSFISGSATISNILFSSFQYEMASRIGSSPILTITLQSLGAAVGNMININNVLVVSTMVGCMGLGGEIIKTNAIPAFIYYIIATITAILLI